MPSQDSKLVTTELSSANGPHQVGRKRRFLHRDQDMKALSRSCLWLASSLCWFPSVRAFQCTPTPVDVPRTIGSSHDRNSDATRRTILRNGIGLLSPFLAPGLCHAVAPITQYETETGLAKVARLLRPDPPKILRQRLARDFAVLLMRSSYAVTDVLDIVPMNQFQRDFFLIRSSEYEPYVASLGPGYVKQGDLSDPSYFDFISFAQYLTISRALSDPETVFEELQPVLSSSDGDESDPSSTTPQQFQTVVIRRTIPNDRLVDEFDKRLGTAILQYLDDVYGDTPSALSLEVPAKGRRPSIDTLQSTLAQLVNLFLVNGFAWEGSVTVTARTPGPQRATVSDADSDASSTEGATFLLTLVSPASLWGHQSLQRQRSLVRNDYLLKTAKQLVQRLGYQVVSSSIQIEGNKEQSYLTVR
jgi:hypothetical protein